MNARKRTGVRVQGPGFRRKRLVLSVIFTSIFPLGINCLLPSIAFAYDFAGGTGEPNDPYQISTAEQLISIGSDPNLLDKSFVLINDIDLDPSLPGRQRFGQAVIAPGISIYGYISLRESAFSGIFDGNDKTIHNLVILSASDEFVGLFGVIGRVDNEAKVIRGIVKNLHLNNASVVGSYFVGGIAGLNGGQIISCSVNGEISGDQIVGGLVGANSNVTIINQYADAIPWKTYDGGLITSSYTEGIVTGDQKVGGLVGTNHYYSKVLACHSTGDVSGNLRVGGLIGSNEYGCSTNESYSLGNVNATRIVGGLVGDNQFGHIDTCYAMGAVSGERWVGGLTGLNLGLILTSYSTGNVLGNEDVGGLIGDDLAYFTGMDPRAEPVPVKGVTYLSYWDADTSGLVASDGGQGKTTELMKLSKTFRGWGYGAKWIIDESYDYPRLSWERKPGFSLIDDPNRYSYGTGEPNDPFQIYTAKELVNIGWHRGDWDKYFILKTDIDLAAVDPNEIVPIGTLDMPFTGRFDGSGKTVTNFKYPFPNYSYAGLFGYLGSGDSNTEVLAGQIIDLHLDAINIAGYLRVGGLVGFNQGTISSCSINGYITGYRYVGGLAGYNDTYGHIFMSKSLGNITGISNVGGITGINNYHSSIVASYSEASVEGVRNLGGIAGYNKNLISNCYSTSIITGEGELFKGGLAGLGQGSSISSFWNIETSGLTFSAGKSGYEGTGLTTAEMQDIDTYLDAGWDFDTIWSICAGQDYPRLQWEQQSCSED